MESLFPWGRAAGGVDHGVARGVQKGRCMKCTLRTETGNFEIRISKHETKYKGCNINDQYTKDDVPKRFCFGFWTFSFRYCFGFRISVFELSSAAFSHSIPRQKANIDRRASETAS
jgi:hypothetical protein